MCELIHDVSTGYIFSKNMKNILLVYGKGKDVFLPPGGHVDQGESFLDAVYREIFEETMIKAELLKKVVFENCPVLYSFETKAKEQDELFIVIEKIKENHFHRDHIYCFILDESKVPDEIIDNDEVYERKWFSVDGLPKQKMYENVRETIEYLVREGKKDE